jgi:hypothetical protein
MNILELPTVIRYVATLTVVVMSNFAQSARAETSSSAHALLAHSIAIVDLHGDLRTISSMKAAAQYVSFDTVENDHSGAPYYATVGSATVTDDLHSHDPSEPLGYQFSGMSFRSRAERYMRRESRRYPALSTAASFHHFSALGHWR